MSDMEELFYQTDFSKYTDLKSKLAERLFEKKTTKRTRSFTYTRLSDDDVEFVNAAQGIQIDPFLNTDLK